MAFNLPSVSLPATTTFRLFTISGDGLTISERACLMSSLLSTMNGRFTTQHGAAELTINLLYMAVESLANELTKASSVTVINTPVSKKLLLEQLGVDEHSKDWKPIPNFLQVPRNPSDVASANTHIMNAYAGTSLVLFSLGKEFTNVNEASAKDKRPKALMGQFGLSDADFPSAPGKPDGPSIEALGQVYSAFSIYTELRAAVVRTFLSIHRQMSHYSPEVGLLMTSFKLLDGAQMAHVGAIKDMIEAHPWLAKVPGLRPSLKEFLEEMRRFAKVPEGVRGYVRLIESNQTPYFPSSKMMPLVAVAVELKSDIEQTLVNYLGGRGKYPDLIAEVRAYQENFKMIQGVDTLSALLNLPDVALPDVQSHATVTPGTTGSI